jgi:hypothetical protein
VRGCPGEEKKEGKKEKKARKCALESDFRESGGLGARRAIILSIGWDVGLGLSI